ncbi:MAG: Uma2 family endonuclease [Anaerolineae bacterium]|nr:Uma2 family endonuclease [Anaerolineae bacterium]
MSSLPVHSNWTVEEYLAFEAESEIRHEFIDGQIYAMAGASKRHNQISSALHYALYGQLIGKNCEVFQADMRVQASELWQFYPDVVVVCGEDRYTNDRQTTLLNPTVLIEVLSPSTEAKDRREKLFHYRSIPSVQEYWMFAQDQIFAERFLRKDSEVWEYRTWDDAEDVVELPTLGCTLALSDVYSRVNFDETE